MKYLSLALFLGFSEACWYGLWWVAFIAIAYCFARYVGWGGAICSVFVISLMLVFIDLHWISSDMREHPEHHRSIDGYFWFGVVCRMAFFNLMLLPATITGLVFRARERGRAREKAVKILACRADSGGCK
jgi:hypothetical protein